LVVVAGVALPHNLLLILINLPQQEVEALVVLLFEFIRLHHYLAHNHTLLVRLLLHLHLA
jgi:hypothetical protein